MKTVLATLTMVSQPCDTGTWDEDANPYKQGASNVVPSSGEGEGDVISSEMEMDMNISGDGMDITVCSTTPCEDFEKGESLIPENASDYGAFIYQLDFTGFGNCIAEFERDFQGFADFDHIFHEFETAEFDTDIPDDGADIAVCSTTPCEDFEKGESLIPGNASDHGAFIDLRNIVMKAALASSSMVSQPCDTETWDEDANPYKQGDIAECITSSQVETEDKTVKSSASGEDTSEDVEEDKEEDKEDNVNETDVVEDSVEDAPTFANVSTSSGSDGDGDDDKDDENDRDKNSRECEEVDVTDTEVKLSKLICELRKLLQLALDDRSVHHDFDGKLPEGWTMRIVEKNKVEIVKRETGLPTECYMVFLTNSDFGRFSKPLYPEKYISSPKDSYKEEGPPVADSNSSHLLDMPVTEDYTEILVPSSVESDDLESIQNTEGEEDVPECITSNRVETEHISISDEGSGEDVGEDKEADKEDEKETVTGLLTFDEVHNVKGKKSEEWDKDGASDTEGEFQATSFNGSDCGSGSGYGLGHHGEGCYPIATYHQPAKFLNTHRRDLSNTLVGDTWNYFRNLLSKWLDAEGGNGCLLSMHSGNLSYQFQNANVPSFNTALSLWSVLHGLLSWYKAIVSVVSIVAWVSILQYAAGREPPSYVTSNLEFAYADIQSTCEHYKTRKGILSWKREPEVWELYHKQETDEWEVILKHLKADYTYLRPASNDISCYTIPIYPDNHNPLLPLALQKKLDEMSPREYLTYVLRELTLEERESLMVDERQRRKTFLVNWPRGNNLSGVKMAQAGFYYVDDYDRVQCVFCRSSLHNWESSDNPMTEHARSFNFCRFVKGLECGNREYRRDVLSPEELRYILFFRNPDMERNRDGSVSMFFPDCGIVASKADQIEYTHEPERETTFDRWPPSSPIPAKLLWESGFYYTGFGDLVRCFYCSVGVRDWRRNDDPWEEHARWFPECSFLVQQKGVGFVNEVHATTPANKKCARMLTYPSGAGNEQKPLPEDMDDKYRRRAHCKRKRPHYWTPEGNVRQKRQKCQPSDEAEDEEAYNVTGPQEPRAEAERRRQAAEQRREEALAQQWERDGAPQEQKDMALRCQTLGHSTDTILNAVRDNEEPFETISDFIETIYKIEERQPPIRVIGPGPVRTAATVGNVPNYLSAEDVLPERRGSVGRHPQGACVICYIGTQQSVNATRIGLPCGHRTFCDRCNREEQVRAEDPEYKVRCPECEGLLTGTITTFLA